MSAKIMLYRRGAQGHIQRLFHMQGSGLAVGADAAVVVNAVGHVGVLLYLGHHDALADGMQRARRDKKAIPLVHRHGVQNLRQGVVFDALGKFLFADLMVKAIVQKGVRLTIQHVPHLSLAVLVLIFQCVLIEGVYLDGQIVPCIDKFYQNRELFKFCAIGAQGFRVSGRIISQGGTVGQVAGAVRVAGEHPGFGQRVQIALHAKIGAQTAAAPQVVFAAGGQFDDCHKQVAPFLNRRSFAGTSP